MFLTTLWDSYTHLLFAFREVLCAGLFSFAKRRAQKLYLNLHESETVLENIFGISFACSKVKIFLLVNENVKNKGGFIMKEGVVKSYEELPLFLNAQMIANVLGISISSAYELLHEEGFPSLRIGNRVVVPKDHFRQWVEDHIGK